MPFKVPGMPVREIGRRLNAGWVLEGSVRKAGNRVRITAQLIQAEADKHLWAERYDRNLEDIFATQSEIAEQVAEALRIRLAESDKARLSRVPTQDTEAHLLYLRGVGRFNHGNIDSYGAALKDLEEAIEKDPGYAPAHASIAFVHYLFAMSETMPAEEQLRRAEAAAQQALRLDPELAFAHAVRALLLDSPFHQDPVGARAEALRALELSPSLASAHLAFAWLSRATPEESERSAERALELDPLNLSTRQLAATRLLYIGRVDRAAALFEQVLQSDPTASLARNNLGLCRVLQGRSEEGIREIRMCIDLDRGFSAPRYADLVFALVRAGRTDEARAVLQELLDHHRATRAGSISIALSYARLGEIDPALQWLETAYQDRSPYLATLPGELGIERLRDDPRFRAFLAKIDRTPTEPSAAR